MVDNTLIQELRTGQVAFLSGLMAGFSLSVAVNVLRYGLRTLIAQVTFCSFIFTALLFLLALYIDVRLTLELASVEAVSNAMVEVVTRLRMLGTTAASIGFTGFLFSIGALGWLSSRTLGYVTSSGALVVFVTLSYVWYVVQLI